MAWTDCPECNGEGIVERETYHRDMISARDETCGNCGGSGEIQVEEADLIEDDGFITIYESGKAKQ